jgi:hypothetical protein
MSFSFVAPSQGSWKLDRKARAMFRYNLQRDKELI